MKRFKAGIIVFSVVFMGLTASRFIGYQLFLPISINESTFDIPTPTNIVCSSLPYPVPEYCKTPTIINPYPEPITTPTIRPTQGILDKHFYLPLVGGE